MKATQLAFGSLTRPPPRSSRNSNNNTTLFVCVVRSVAVDVGGLLCTRRKDGLTDETHDPCLAARPSSANDRQVINVFLVTTIFDTIAIIVKNPERC